MSTTLLLASTSPYRRALLKRLGLPFEVQAPPFEENPVPGMAPIDVARSFAEGKARSIEAGLDAWILGCDQVAELDGRILRKTTHLEECRQQLRELSGQTHALHSALALWSPSTQTMFSEVVTVRLRMHALRSDVIDRYVELDQPIGSAGGYFFEGRGIALFDDVQGGDDSAIVGLPLMSLCRLLRKAGIEPMLRMS